jgi:hypothetical protein
MGLSNAASRARNYSATITRNQGGGDKKAGFPPQVGRTAWESIYLQTNKYGSNCCKLKTLQFTANPNVRQSRPISSAVTMAYFR